MTPSKDSKEVKSQNRVSKPYDGHSGQDDVRSISLGYSKITLNEKTYTLHERLSHKGSYHVGSFSRPPNHGTLRNLKFALKFGEGKEAKVRTSVSRRQANTLAKAVEAEIDASVEKNFDSAAVSSSQASRRLTEEVLGQFEEYIGRRNDE